MEKKKDWKEQISGGKEKVQYFFGKGTKGKKTKEEEELRNIKREADI